MLILFALPVLVAVAAMHRSLQLYAPSNVLARRVRAGKPRWLTAGMLIWLAGLLAVSTHVVDEAIAHGAPGWLNLMVLVLAWDAIKVAALGCHVLVRRALSITNRSLLRRARARPTGQPS
jgi:hypothetical protein